MRVSGSKNAALPILAATLLSDEAFIINNVPDIRDVHTMIAIMKAVGSDVRFSKNTIRVQTKKIDIKSLPEDLCLQMRASILLLPALIQRSGHVALPYPGGCVLGKRPVDTHVRALIEFGTRYMQNRDGYLEFRGKIKHSARLVMSEFSVTGTENAIMAAAVAPGVSHIRLAAIEPHVQDLCRFLVAGGIQIEGIGTHHLKVHGGGKLKSLTHTVIGDYLEAGTLLLAGAVTGGKVTVTGINPEDLEAVTNLLVEMGMKISSKKSAITMAALEKPLACKRLQTNVFPGFPTDLQPPFCVLLTQAKGESLIHETLFEERFKYFEELEKMGAQITKLNPHQAIVSGPTKLRGTRVKSFDLRAGAAMVLAGLAAKGTTIVEDISYIDRGYERFEEKLRDLGADIQRES